MNLADWLVGCLVGRLFFILQSIYIFYLESTFNEFIQYTWVMKLADDRLCMSVINLILLVKCL